ncbi:MAG: hypothetical protein K2Y28_09585 [Burkholderiaceae bacterium]|nr:hypothetical protein [Burkholderiaceae bacterium]
MRKHTVLITEAELVASPPERVYAVLEERARTSKGTWDDGGFDECIEKNLLDRNEPLIDLALAKFCKYGETAAMLFNRRSERDEPIIDLASARFSKYHETAVPIFNQTPATGTKGAHEQALRLAVLSNHHLDGVFRSGRIPWCAFNSHGVGIFEWLSKANDAELQALFTNPSIDQNFLLGFLEGKDAWVAMNEPRRFLAIQFLANNKRMSESYFGDLDGSAEYSYNSVFFAAWNLAETLPATRTNAIALGGLLDVTQCYGLEMKDPLAIALRWTPAADDKEGKEDEEKLHKNGYAWGYPLVRKSLARLASKKQTSSRSTLLNHADPAVRDAAYEFFEMKLDEIRVAYDLDKILAVNSCLRNDFVWRTTENRQALYGISWKACGELNNSYMDTVNAYNFQEKRQMKLHPDWFSEEVNEVGKSALPASKADIEALTQAVGRNEYLIRESTTLMNHQVSDIFDRLRWVWWFALGALVGSLSHQFI